MLAKSRAHFLFIYAPCIGLLTFLLPLSFTLFIRAFIYRLPFLSDALPYIAATAILILPLTLVLLFARAFYHLGAGSLTRCHTLLAKTALVALPLTLLLTTTWLLLTPS